MANHCFNWISLTGESKDLLSLKAKLETYKQTKYLTEWGDYVLGIGEIGDTPEIFKERHKNDPYYVYGTRWFEFEIIDDHIDDKSGQGDFVINGSSAWSPPITLIERICEEYNLTAEMEYEEGGMDFAGKLEIDKNGIKFHDEMTAYEFKYKEDMESWFESLIYNYEQEEDYDEILEELKVDHSYATLKELKLVVVGIKQLNIL